jgi:hypothetical protein
MIAELQPWSACENSRKLFYCKWLCPCRTRSGKCVSSWRCCFRRRSSYDAVLDSAGGKTSFRRIVHRPRCLVIGDRVSSRSAESRTLGAISCRSRRRCGCSSGPSGSREHCGERNTPSPDSTAESSGSATGSPHTQRLCGHCGVLCKNRCHSSVRQRRPNRLRSEPPQGY